MEDEVFKLSSGGTELVAPGGICVRDPAVIGLVAQVGLEGLSIHEWITHVHT
jgi:hypothetical protein